MHKFPLKRLALAALLLAGGAVSCSTAAQGRPPAMPNPNAPVTSGPAGELTQQPLSEGIAGRVTGPSGAPVEGALIQVRSLDPAGAPIPEMAVISTADGSYQWRLRPGSYELTATHQTLAPVSERAEVYSDQVSRLDFDMRR
jgi:hypothetical protein